MFREWIAVVPTFYLVAACSLPQFEYEGEHVVVATDVVGRVCEGTIERLDRGVEHMDQQLGLPSTAERVPVAIIDHSDLYALCKNGRGGCAYAWELAVVVPGRFESSVLHEMAHVRVGHRRSGSVGLFQEGIAVALSPAICRPSGELPTADELLPISSGRDLDSLGYYLGGELVAWLLETHGPEQFTSFVQTLERPEALRRSSDPEFVRASYRSHFGSELDEDLHTHLRDPKQMSPESLGCVAPQASWSGDRVRLQADLRCDSARVQNNFVLADQVYVDWTLLVPETQTPRRHRLLDRIPDDTWLEIRPCTCDLDSARARVKWTSETGAGASVVLEPGGYLVRWRGDLDGDAELDIVIESYDDPG
jgi:hypothetical protein